jgi:hypothetical protein
MIIPLSAVPEIGRIKSLLEQLPVLPEQRCNVQTKAEAIYIACVFGMIPDETPTKRAVGVKKALQELTDLRKALSAVHEKFQALHAEAYGVLATEVIQSWSSTTRIEIFGKTVTVDRTPHPKVFDIDVRAMLKHVDAAHEVLVANPGLELGTRKRKNAAAGVARNAVQAYEVLTGKPVTRITDPTSHKAKGPLLELIRVLFSVLNISASAESQLRNAIDDQAEANMEKRGANKTR